MNSTRSSICLDDYYETLDCEYFVSESDVTNYLNYKLLSADCKVKNFSSLSDDENNTLLYVINYYDGWEIIAADKRAPVPLMSSKHGDFEDIPINHPIHAWIDVLAEDVLATRLSNSIKSSNPELTEYCISFWKAINSELDASNNDAQTRIDHYIGHYVLSEVHSYEEAFDSIPHLIQTKWSQDEHSCNYYVPYRTDTLAKAPAGCVAVSGAQMLYFLHYTLGVPQNAPSQAYCSGDIDGYTMYQGEFSNTVWGSMNPYGNQTVGILIAWVGSRVHMNYGNTGSSADTDDLVNDVFAFHGIDCEYSDYTVNAVQSSLSSGIPVIARADANRTLGLFYYDSHSFIIDSYIRYRTHNSYIYEWEWYDYDPTIPYPKVPGKVEESYSSPTVRYFKMNWGWGGMCDDTYCMCDSDWIVELDDTYNFQYRRHIIHNFSVQSN